MNALCHTQEEIERLARQPGAERLREIRRGLAAEARDVLKHKRELLQRKEEAAAAQRKREADARWEAKDKARLEAKRAKKIRQ